MNESSGPATGSPGPGQPLRRTVVRSVARALGSTIALVAVYYLLPLDHASTAAAIGILVVGLAALIGLIGLQVRSIGRSRFPSLRAVEALATSIPLFLLLFAGTYLAMSSMSAGNFGQRLTHTDAMYFALTVLSTVGFGDITAKTEAARLVVSGQMAADLVLVGLGAKIIFGAVTRRRGQQP